MIRLVLLLVLILAAPVAAAERRVALVIANSAYGQVAPLANPGNDGRLVAEALTKAGFTVDRRDNLDLSHFMHALRDFRGQADGADVALIYYAGHGAQAEGQNYLVPTDADMAAERDLDAEGVDLERFMTTLGGAKVRIAIVDACRNNPFRPVAASISTVTNGLAQVDVDDVLVIFSAAPGKTASDGTGTNSPFALALARRLPQPGLVLQRLGGVVRDDVIAATANAQRPFISQSITGEPLYLVAGAESRLPTVGTGGGGSTAARSTATAAPERTSPATPVFTDSWVAIDPRLPMGRVTVERADSSDAVLFRVSGTYPTTKRSSDPAPQARIIRVVAYRVVEGRVTRLPRSNRFRIGSWNPGAPFATTFSYPRPAPGAAPPADLALRLCMGENDGPGHDFCFYSPNLVKDGPQQLLPDLSRGAPAARPGGPGRPGPGNPGIARRRPRG